MIAIRPVRSNSFLVFIVPVEVSWCFHSLAKECV
jgi:hypothetical protein